MLVKAQSQHDGEEEDAVFSLLDDDGNVRPGARPPEVSDADALRLYREMLRVRLVDERFIKLQRQGRLGFYMTATGEEATHFACHAMQDRDWIFPSYREIVFL